MFASIDQVCWGRLGIYLKGIFLHSFQHPDYNPFNYNENDFCLLRLSEPANITSKVGIACLAVDHSKKYVGVDLTISGWGLILYSGMSSSLLRSAQVKTLSDEECEFLMDGMMYPKPDKYICATKVNTDACEGDSGGD